MYSEVDGQWHLHGTNLQARACSIPMKHTRNRSCSRRVSSPCYGPHHWKEQINCSSQHLRMIWDVVPILQWQHFICKFIQWLSIRYNIPNTTISQLYRHYHGTIPSTLLLLACQPITNYKRNGNGKYMIQMKGWTADRVEVLRSVCHQSSTQSNL